jgi:hypothetical protein
LTTNGARAAAMLVWGLAAAAPVISGQSTGSFVRLFDGTLKGWTVENSDAGNFTVRDGVLRVEGPAGWLRSEREYADFSLKAEFRFVTAEADSGLFVRARGDSEFMRGWPNSSYQVQIRNPLTPSRLPPVGGLFRHGMPAGETTLDAPLVEKLAKATGEWQLLEVDVIGDRIMVRFNGAEVMRAGNIANATGYIGLQGETGTVEFRSVEIREQRP